LEDQITIVAVATRHEKNRRGRRELPHGTDWTRDFSVVAFSRDGEESVETPAFAREQLLDSR
jgi:hypothetical protein